MSTKWVFKSKSNGLFEARLVVRGFQEEIHALVAQCLVHIDVKFHISEFRYQVTGIYQADKTVGSNKVFLLNKSLYGLKESPRNWCDYVTEFMLSLNFTREKFDSPLFFLEMIK